MQLFKIRLTLNYEFLAILEKRGKIMKELLDVADCAYVASKINVIRLRNCDRAYSKSGNLWRRF